MSEAMNEDVIETPDELTVLKSRAELLGVKYHPSISLEKLRDKVNAVVEGTKEGSTEAEEKEVESTQAKKIRLRDEAAKLIRIRVSCMNPNKKEWEGEIFTAGNSGVGTFKKYVPFNSDEGWHVPNIIYQQLVERQCQVFTTVTDSRGNKHRKGKLIKEFAIEALPPLTQEELDELARRQAMSQSVG